MMKRRSEPARKRRADPSGVEHKKGENMAKKLKVTPTFIAIHLGAGEHSLKKKDVYKSLCEKACRAGMKILLSGGTADDAVLAATIVLEDSELVNAGRGSNLTVLKTVECDAGFMSGDGHFGGVAAIPDVPNPILVAKSIADSHRAEPLLSCGRVPPTLIMGEGARLWAQSNGIPICQRDEMVSKKSAKTYSKYMNKLSEIDLNAEISDTVGAIAVDGKGHVAATVSSGGNWLKHSGRVGHAPLFGSGCWAFNGGTKNASVAVSSSGAGEMLSKVNLPQHISKIAKTEDCVGFVESLSKTIQQEFLDNDVLRCHKETKNVGLIAIRWEGSRGEFVWGHTSKNFIVGYLTSSSKSVKMDFSILPEKKEAGKSLQVQGIPI